MGRKRNFANVAKKQNQSHNSKTAMRNVDPVRNAELLTVKNKKMRTKNYHDVLLLLEIISVHVRLEKKVKSIAANIKAWKKKPKSKLLEFDIAETITADVVMHSAMMVRRHANS